ncbi:Carnitine operon protein CaiE [Sporomusa silvacetica DSM 10669]|uniref:Carnitine operon protein CaiE n=1 Tax=Sporomusa silvacetica DSM 10669 TaxID=1123289 RepID=A0ABZ3ISF0_9FIRM|nr:gamma carbonic anhydrase family protein [Sporomusa silvacetica]OZC14497.1 2,3,4,5-tetrahydropyridine-2,6-dicarboxylate N-acetyltransferase [Sporomusa silvacetica DSM 10669]
MIIEFEGIRPTLDERTFVADGAKVIGNVTMKQFSSLWVNVVVRGDVNRIEIGRYSNVQDNCVVHAGDNQPTIIGDYVTVGHNTIIHSCIIEEHCLIGMGVSILAGAMVGKGSIIAAGAVVKENQIIPPHSLVVGVPGRVVKFVPEEWDSIHAQAIKYKTLWRKWRKLLRGADGEGYQGENII